MPLLPSFEPPANVDDFSSIPDQRAAWDEFISLAFDVNVTSVEVDDAVGRGKCQFYNPKTISTDAPSATDVIRWKGFPLLIAAKHPGNKRAAWAEAEAVTDTDAHGQRYSHNFRPQDEYLEWCVLKDENGKIIRVSFTCEGPEYWDALAHGYPREFDLPVAQGGLGGTRKTSAKGDKKKVLSLYQQLVSPNVRMNDLFDAHGRYNPFNRWNTTDGAVHLTHPSNSLGAEINIAARATVLRQQGGQPITDANDLIACSGYGDGGRASDPHIGDEVNKLARSGYAVTLLNPVGLYIESLETVGWVTPNGKPAAQFWRILRGVNGMALHVVFEVPASEGYTVSDITIGGQAIQFGGQIAEHINIKLTGVACRQNSFHNPSLPCPGRAPVAALMAANEAQVLKLRHR